MSPISPSPFTVLKDEAAEVMAALWSIEFPEQPMEAAEMSVWQLRVGEDKFCHRAAAFATSGEPLAGFGGTDTTPVAPPSRIMFDYWGQESADQDFYLAYLSESEALARAHSALNIGHWVRDCRTQRRRWLEENGCTVIQTVPATRLYVPDANLAPFLDKAESVKQAGIRVVPISDLEAQGVDWVEPLYHSTVEMSQDVPSTDTHEVMPLEAYRRMLANRVVYDLSLMFVALDGPTVVGYTRLTPLPLKPDTARTGLSGVLRKYRRRGIVTALKVACIKALHARGIQWVITDNDETNPLLQLNKALGYTEFMTFLQYGKPLN